MLNENMLDAILHYGQMYRREHLTSRYDTDILLADEWEALLFFFGRAFYQGRRDDVSKKVHEAAVSVLISAQVDSNRRFDRTRLTGIEQALRERIGKGRIGKGGDVKMVISTLEYLGKIHGGNIVADSVARVSAGQIGQHYNDLQIARNSDLGIYQVGPKIASFYLRDLVSLFSLDSCVSSDFQWALQPIDVWVRRLAVKTGLVTAGGSDDAIRQAIVNLSVQRGCSPLLFNQGVWYLGANSYALLLEALEKQGAVTASSMS